MEFSIGELARRSGYAVQTVRYYEQSGLMPTPARTAGGQRRYDETQLRQLLFIRHARDLGFEVEAIRSLLRLAAHPDAPCDSVDAIAKDHLAAITYKIARLSALRREVMHMIKQCQRGRIAECRVIDALLSDRGAKALPGRSVGESNKHPRASPKNDEKMIRPQRRS